MLRAQDGQVRARGAQLGLELAQLSALVVEAGLDAGQARQVLEDGRYADEVRAQEAFYQGQGVRAVPSVIVNDRYLIQGGQPPEVFEESLRKIAAES